jgi:iron complex transport system permease protein
MVASDTAARLVVAPIILPIGAITSFLGAPLFLYLVFKGVVEK